MENQSTIERIKDLEAKATPGPWLVFELLVGTKEGNYVCDPLISDTLPESQVLANRELIAEMRNVLPKLIEIAEQSSGVLNGECFERLFELLIELGIRERS